MSEIKIESAVNEGSKNAQVSVDKKESKNIATWQFRKRQYQEITNIIDTVSDKTRSGNLRKVVIKARNWRVDLNLSDPIEKKMHEHLLKRKDVNNEYYLLTDKSKVDKVSEEGATLQKLMEMSIPQLMNCITAEELISVGIIPGIADKYQLVAAILKKKKLA